MIDKDSKLDAIRACIRHNQPIGIVQEQPLIDFCLANIDWDNTTAPKVIAFIEKQGQQKNELCKQTLYALVKKHPHRNQSKLRIAACKDCYAFRQQDTPIPPCQFRENTKAR